MSEAAIQTPTHSHDHCSLNPKPKTPNDNGTNAPKPKTPNDNLKNKNPKPEHSPLHRPRLGRRMVSLAPPGVTQLNFAGLLFRNVSLATITGIYNDLYFAACWQCRV